MNFKIDEGTAAVLLRMSGEARHQCIDAMMMFVFCGEDKEPEDPTAAAAYGFMKMAEVSKASAAENGKREADPRRPTTATQPKKAVMLLPFLSSAECT